MKSRKKFNAFLNQAIECLEQAELSKDNTVFSQREKIYKYKKAIEHLENAKDCLAVNNGQVAE